MAKVYVDLNADVGEQSGDRAGDFDAALFEVVTSANVACGFHAGDACTMHRAVRQCAARNVEIGAHPGFADLDGFGRHPIAIEPDALEYQMAYQIGALQAMAAYGKTPLRHVKPHGALYNMAATDAAYARAIVQAVKTVDTTLILVGLPDSALERSAAEKGLRFAREGFCDRVYLSDGSLMPRTEPGAIIVDSAAAAAQAVRLARHGEIVAADGAVLKQDVETLCIHGDEATAPAVAKAVRKALQDAGVTLVPMRSLV